MEEVREGVEGSLPLCTRRIPVATCHVTDLEGCYCGRRDGREGSCGVLL